MTARGFVLGGPFGAEPPEVSHARLTHFADTGGRLVETAHSYARGQAEPAVGEWLRKNPGVLRVATKVGHDRTGQDIPLDRRTVCGQVRDSLANLGVDVLDVLLLHCDDPARPVSDLAETLLELVTAGYARLVGVANWPPDRLSTLAAHLAEAGHRPVASYQFSLAVPDPVRLGGSSHHANAAVLRVIREHQLPLLCWSAQAQGFFARTEGKPDGDRPDPFESPGNRARRARCAELATQLRSRPETVALAWTLHHPDVWPSIGPRTTEQLDRSLAARRLSLTREQLSWLSHGG